MSHISGGSTKSDDESKTDDSDGKRPAEASGHASGTYNNGVPGDGDEVRQCRLCVFAIMPLVERVKGRHSWVGFSFRVTTVSY